MSVCRSEELQAPELSLRLQTPTLIGCVFLMNHHKILTPCKLFAVISLALYSSTLFKPQSNKLRFKKHPGTLSIDLNIDPMCWGARVYIVCPDLQPILTEIRQLERMGRDSVTWMRHATKETENPKHSNTPRSGSNYLTGTHNHCCRPASGNLACMAPPGSQAKQPRLGSHSFSPHAPHGPDYLDQRAACFWSRPLA